MSLNVILGLGESGRACAQWFVHTGDRFIGVDDRAMNEADFRLPAKIATHCKTGVNFSQPESFLTGATRIVVSPGLSPARLNAIMDYAHAHRIKVCGELELFAQALAELQTRHHYRPKVLAITGTNGKTTTTLLTANLLNSAGVRAQAAGNVSPSLLDALLEMVAQPQAQWPQAWVLELSSFQLHYPNSLRCDAASVLNISQDHLDWHASLDEYVSDKLSLLNQSTVAIIPTPRLQGDLAPYVEKIDTKNIVLIGDAEPDSTTSSIQKHAAESELKQWRLVQENGRSCLQHGTTVVIDCDALLLRGRHNYLNALTALALCDAIGVRPQNCVAGLQSYRGEAHRCQLVQSIRGVEYIDDSKGTNVGATLAALQSAAQVVNARHAQQWLILGGEGKGQDFSPLCASAHLAVGGIALIGKAAVEIKHALTNVVPNKAMPAKAMPTNAVPSFAVPIFDSQTLEQAVHDLSARAKSGDQILLSPACASFDQFRDYKHRGEVFVQVVSRLAHHAKGARA